MSSGCASKNMRLPMLQQMFHAAVLKRETFRKLKVDRRATGQALVVVLMVGVATGIGALDDEGLRAFPAWIATVFVGWLVWVSLVYLIGGKMLRGSGMKTTWVELARPLGFAQSPGLLRAAGIVTSLGVAISLVAIIWQLVAMIVALREVFQFQSYWRAMAVIAIALIPYLVIVGGLNVLLARL